MGRLGLVSSEDPGKWHKVHSLAVPGSQEYTKCTVDKIKKLQIREKGGKSSHIEL